VDSPQNIISFCTGYGGIELGLHRISDSFRTVCYVEIELFPTANLVAKIEQGEMDAAPIWTDIKTFPAQAFSGKVHGIIGGYPCQPFSHAGQRKGTDDPRHLWPYIEQHIRTIRPVWCFFENVGGHLSLGFKEVFRSLRDMGYKVEAGLFTAAEVGLPHKRERLFILAYSKGIGALRGPRAIQCKDGRSRGSLLRQPVSTDAELANAGKPGCQGSERAESFCDEGQTSRGPVTECRYPARPGQPQHDWEEPRTVKPGMGRTINGTPSRVDELRLLGNGVVPQTAELAFRTLWNRING
jgi:DNA (cytosine-5)-methyltransferase 1